MGIFSELKKRRVFATAAIYIPGAWLAAEILLAIFDRFRAPAWAGDVVVILFLLGFPVALLLSWLFDVTGEGIKRASPGTALGIISLLASGLFLSVGTYLTYQVFSGQLDEVRIAVLPFHTNDLNEAAAPYGSGVADDIRSSLRQLAAFKVPAQTSSEAVLGMGLDIPGVATRLGVEYILEGALELTGDRLQIDVVLLDEGGSELWSQRYERAVRDLFEIQNEIVRSLSMELGLGTSDPVLQAQLRKPPPTNDPEAHRLYLSGRLLPEEHHLAEGERRRMQAFMAARQRDPGYPAVYAAIAREYAAECWTLDDRKSPKCDLAIRFAEEGLELDDQLADAWAVLAMVRALRYDWNGAQDAIDHFYQLPSPDIISNALPIAYWNLGRLQEAWDTILELYENDPLNAQWSYFLGAWAYVLLEDRELSDHYAAINRELAPGSHFGAWPDLAMHRVSMEQAIENARQMDAIFQIKVDWAPVLVPVIYGETEPESAWPVMDTWVTSEGMTPAQYWSMLLYANRIDEYIELAFQLFEDQTLNPGWMLMSWQNSDALRTHPRFLELLKFVGYSDYWDKAGWPRFCPLVGGERRCDGRPAAEEKE